MVVSFLKVHIHNKTMCSISKKTKFYIFLGVGIYYAIWSIFLFPSFYNTLERKFAKPLHQIRMIVASFGLFPPQISPSDTYTIGLVGDSMVDFMRPGEEDFRKMLAKYYLDKKFEFFNYGFGSTNILSVQARFETDTKYHETIFPAISKRKFDLILLESFGNNPLSQFPLEKGLKKQEEALDQIVTSIKKTHPQSIIVFFTTVAPNEKKYAQSILNLSPKERSLWVIERNTYIKNHIKYAKAHNIPLVDAYTNSLDSNGNGKLEYISKSDYIHPSKEGVEFIYKTMAQYIFQNRLLPL